MTGISPFVAGLGGIVLAAGLTLFVDTLVAVRRGTRSANLEYGYPPAVVAAVGLGLADRGVGWPGWPVCWPGWRFSSCSPSSSSPLAGADGTAGAIRKARSLEKGVAAADGVRSRGAGAIRLARRIVRGICDLHVRSIPPGRRVLELAWAGLTLAQS